MTREQAFALAFFRVPNVTQEHAKRDADYDSEIAHTALWLLCERASGRVK